MAHAIDMTTGHAAIFTAGERPWHGLGTHIDQAANSRDALKLARLNWHVQPSPVHATVDPHTPAIHSTQHMANVRTDTRAILGIVGKGYKVFQNHEAFDFMDDIVGDKLAMYESAGALKGGRKVWMLARIPREYHATPDDVIQPYVLLVNSHDGSSALRMIPTTVRVVCNNTLNLALRRGNAEGLTIRHCASLDERVREAREKLGVVAARFDLFDAELHAMLAQSMTGDRLARYFEQILPPAETELQREKRTQTLEQLQQNFENPRNSLPGIRGTAWAAYNAVSEWADHQRGFRGKDDFARRENRLNAIWFGSSHRIKQDAYKLALVHN